MAGKLPPAVLKALLAAARASGRPELWRGPAIGEDAAVLDLGGDLAVVSTDPVTGATGEQAGWLSVHVNCNDVAAAGAEPVAFWPVLVLGDAEDPGPWMRGVARAAGEVGVAIAGGHTEFAPRGLLAGPGLILGVALGRTTPAKLAAAGNLRPGHALVLTKSAGLEGTALRLPAAGLYRHISVVPDARAARDAGCRAMHDVTEGGLLGAVWEMAEASGCGVEVDAAAVPVAPETRALCTRDGLDPLRLLGSGALLCGADDGSALVGALADAGIPAAVVGGALPAAEGRWLRRGGGRHPLQPPIGDEYWEPARTALAVGRERPSPEALALLALADPAPEAVNADLARGALFVARRGGRAVGAAVLAAGEITQIAVAPPQQRQGIGRALLEAVAAAGRRDGLPALEVGTAANGVSALLFYQKCGFRAVGVDPDWFVGRYATPEFENGLPCRDRIRLRRALL